MSQEILFYPVRRNFNKINIDILNRAIPIRDIVNAEKRSTEYHKRKEAEVPHHFDREMNRETTLGGSRS
jgi:hypothetical protein